MIYYRDLETNKIYSADQLEKLWNDLPEDVKNDYSENDINNFAEWLEAASDMSGNLQILNF